MAVTFQHRGTGRTVTRPDPDDEPVRRRRQRALAIVRLDRSPHWQRVDETGQVDVTPIEQPPGTETVAVEPKPSEVRRWARENGIEVNARGALPGELIERYKTR